MSPTNPFSFDAKENVNNMPIKEQAFLAFKNNTHTPENSQYFKIANEEFEHWQEPLMDMFPNLKKDKIRISVAGNIQAAQ